MHVETDDANNGVADGADDGGDDVDDRKENRCPMQ